MHPLARVATVFFAGALSLGSMAVPAMAASPALLSADPADGSSINTRPSAVTLTFTQDVTSSSTISVVGPTTGTSPCPKDAYSATASTVLKCTFQGSPSPTLPDGLYTVNYSAGSGPATSYGFTLDTVSPVAPAGLTFTPANYRAVDDANNTGLTLSGTSEKVGDKVTVVLSGGVTVSGTTAAGTDGTFSVTFSSAQVRTLAEGTITASVTSTDKAGNTGPGGSKTAVKDTASPAAPTVRITPTPINNANQDLVVVSGTADGATVDISLSGGTAQEPLNIDVKSGRYSHTFDSTELPDGPVTARSVTVDGVGNRSAPTLATTTKDTAAPAAPSSMTAPTFISTPTVDVSGRSEPGSTLAVTATDTPPQLPPSSPQTAKGSVVVPSSGAWTVTLNVSTFAEGTVTFKASATDVVGNKGPEAVVTRTKDTTGPGQPATLVATPATYTTASTTFRVSGTVASAEANTPGVTVDLVVSDSDPATPNLSAPGVPVSGNAFAKEFTAAQMAGVAEGVLTLTAIVRDEAGNPGAARTASAAKDTRALDLVSTTPAPGASVKSVSTVSATYNEALASTSTLMVTSGAGTTLVGSTAVSGKTITFTPVTPVTEAMSPYVVTLRGIDTADASDTEDDTFTFKLDATAPPVPVISSVTNPVNADNQTAVVVTGTSGEPNATITVAIGSVTGTTSSGANGAWTVSGLNVTPLADGTLSVSAKATDTAGNTSAASPATTTVKETVRPTVTSVTPANGSRVPTPTTVKFTFSEPLATGSVAIAGVPGSSSVSGSTVTFTPTGPIPDGVRTATASVTDARGNSGTGTSTFTVGPEATSTSTTLNAPAAEVVYGQAITLSGRVTRDNTVAAERARLTAVTLDGTVVDLGTVPVAADGTFSTTLRPAVNARYTVTYPGDSRNLSSSSPSRRTNVAARVTARSATGPATRPATIVGQVSPALSGTTVTIFRIANGRRIRLGSTKVDGRRYSFTTRKLSRGTSRIEVRVDATTNNTVGSVRFVARRS